MGKLEEKIIAKYEKKFGGQRVIKNVPTTTNGLNIDISYRIKTEDFVSFLRLELLTYRREIVEEIVEEIEKHEFVLCYSRPDLCKKWKCKCKCHINIFKTKS